MTPTRYRTIVEYELADGADIGDAWEIAEGVEARLLQQQGILGVRVRSVAWTDSSMPLFRTTDEGAT